MHTLDFFPADLPFLTTSEDAEHFALVHDLEHRFAGISQGIFPYVWMHVILCMVSGARRPILFSCPRSKSCSSTEASPCPCSMLQFRVAGFCLHRLAWLFDCLAKFRISFFCFSAWRSTDSFLRHGCVQCARKAVCEDHLNFSGRDLRGCPSLPRWNTRPSAKDIP